MHDQLAILALQRITFHEPTLDPRASGAGGNARAFADPLDDPAWDGLRWALPFLTALARPPSGLSRAPRPVPSYTRSPLRIR